MVRSFEFALAPLALLAALVLPRPAAALNLSFSFSFQLGFAPEAVAYGADTTADGSPGRLFIAENTSGGNGDNVIRVFDPLDAITSPMGPVSETRNFATTGTNAEFDEIRGLDYIDASNTLLISTNERGGGLLPSRVREIDQVGATIGGGIDLILASPYEPEATFFHDGRNTFFVADEEGVGEIGTVQEFALDGTPGDGVNGAFFEVFDDLGYDDPNGMDWLGDFIFVGDDNSGAGFVSRLEVYDLGGASVDNMDNPLYFREEWSVLTSEANTNAATGGVGGFCDFVTDKGENCADFEGMTIDLIDVGQGPQLHLVAIFEDQQTLIAWTLSDLPLSPGGLPGPPVPEPSVVWLLGAGAVFLARRARA